MAALMVFLFLRLPTAFLPAEDQGVLFTQVQAPVGATQERTMEVMQKIERHFLDNEKDAVDSVFAVQGFSFGGSGQNTGHRLRQPQGLVGAHGAAASRASAVAGRAMGAFSQIKDAFVFAFAPPAVPELGIAGGYNFYLKDNVGLGHEALTQARNQFLGAAAQSKLLANVRPNGQEDTPQFRIDIDNEKAGALGLTMADINETLAVAWGSQYIDDFIDRGRVKRVIVQADAPFRMVPEDFDRWSVRNAQGRDGAVPRLRHLALGLRLAAAGALQRRVGDEHQRRARAGRELGRRDGRSRAARRAAAPGHRAWSGPARRTRSARRARRRRSSTRCRSWSCSCASPRCTRAGPCPPRCC